MGFGAIGLIGNWIGGHAADRSPLGATAAFTLLLATGMAASVWLARSHGWFAAALALWGVAYTALFPICQVRVMKATSQAQALAGTFNVSAANAGIGLGAVTGGLAISHGGVGAAGYVATCIAVLALILSFLTTRIQPPKCK